MLFPYNSSLGIYHCPADRSTLTDPAGQDGGTPRARSYNMSQSVNGYPQFDPYLYAAIPCFTKLTDIKLPNIANCMVFIDENEWTLLDSQFGMPTDYYDGGWATWFDMPANRHDQAANLSFADGHVEHYKWVAPMIFTTWLPTITPAEMPDWLRVKAGVKQDMNLTGSGKKEWKLFAGFRRGADEAGKGSDQKNHSRDNQKPNNPAMPRRNLLKIQTTA